jgi:hypothetical protein
MTASRALDRRLAYAFAPLVKRAFGAATGVIVGGGIFAVTAFHLLVAPESGAHLALLRQYFAYYDHRTWTGALMGLLWGFWAGFVIGWFAAFARNFAMATWLFWIRTRARLAADRDFLDHM